jgi:hypothetical protein
MLIPTWRQVVRAALFIGLIPAIWWAWYSISNFLGAAASFDSAFHITAAQPRSDWKNVLAIAQFLAVTAGPSAVIGTFLTIQWTMERRRRS